MVSVNFVLQKFYFIFFPGFYIIVKLLYHGIRFDQLFSLSRQFHKVINLSIFDMSVIFITQNSTKQTFRYHER